MFLSFPTLISNGFYVTYQPCRVVQYAKENLRIILRTFTPPFESNQLLPLNQNALEFTFTIHIENFTPMTSKFTLNFKILRNSIFI